MPQLPEKFRGVCLECMGRGEYVLTRRQPEHTTHSNPRWEPWEPDTGICQACDGTGSSTPLPSEAPSMIELSSRRSPGTPHQESA